MSASPFDGNLRAILDAAPDATLLVDRRGEIAFASPRIASVLGYLPAELAGKSVEMLVPESLAVSHRRHRAAFSADPHARPMGAGLRLVGVHKDGREIPIDVSLGPVRLGEEQLVICTIRDVSERRKRGDEMAEAAERAAQRERESHAEAWQSQEHLRLFVEHAPAAIAMFDRQMRYLNVSRRWLSDYGLQDETVIGRSHYDVFPEVPDHWRELHRRGLAGEDLKSEEEAVVRRDGHVDWLRWEIHPWRTVAGEVGGIIIFSEMITARKLADDALLKAKGELEQRVADRTLDLEAAKEEAVRATALKSRFLAAASHDLRQPLQAANIYLAALSRGLASEADRRTCEMARRPLRGMADILDTLLDLSRIESGLVKVELRDIDLDDLLSGLAADCRPQASEKRLALHCAKSGAVVRSDPALLRRVVANLLANAIRYTDRGEVSVGADVAGEIARVWVKDTGKGIPEDARAKIFDEYVQLGNQSRDPSKGLGLGLSIVKFIARLLDHRIQVRSEVGVGSTFSIDVPLAGAAVLTREPIPASGQSPTPRPVVLIVDDDSAVADSMLMLLPLLGAEPHRAGDGGEALSLIAAGLRPGLIISDFRLPGADGAEVVRGIRQAMGTDVPAIIMTGDTSLKRVEAAGLTGCTVLHKPADPDRIATIIAGLKP